MVEDPSIDVDIPMIEAIHVETEAAKSFSNGPYIYKNLVGPWFDLLAILINPFFCQHRNMQILDLRTLAEKATELFSVHDTGLEVPQQNVVVVHPRSPIIEELLHPIAICEVQFVEPAEVEAYVGELDSFSEVKVSQYKTLMALPSKRCHCSPHDFHACFSFYERSRSPSSYRAVKARTSTFLHIAGQRVVRNNFN